MNKESIQFPKPRSTEFVGTAMEENDEILWFGNRDGLHKLNYITGEQLDYQINPGASINAQENEVTSVLRIDETDLLISTNLGLFEFNEPAASFEKVDIDVTHSNLPLDIIKKFRKVKKVHNHDKFPLKIFYSFTSYR